MKCTIEQYENELLEIPFPHHSIIHSGVVVSGVVRFCDCKGNCGAVTTPAKGIVREFGQCIEFDYAVFCSDCKKTIAFISRYYPGEKIWKMNFQNRGWVNIIDISQGPWWKKLLSKIGLLGVVAKQAVGAIKGFPGNKWVYGVVLIFKLLKDAFQRFRN